MVAGRGAVPGAPKRVLVASHRLPLDMHQDDQKPYYNLINFEGSHRLLWAGISDVPNTTTVIPIGWLDTNNVPEDQQDSLQARLAARNCHVVKLTHEDAVQHYDVFCKGILWPLFHYVLDNAGGTDAVVESAAWDSFCRVNELFAKTIIETYQPGDIIWVNDYHLMLVPQMVRRALPTAMIGFYLHVPFPSSEIFRCLPVRTQLLRGVLAANVVGFQTYSYARHFISTSIRTVDCEASPAGIQIGTHFVSVGIFPAGINYELVDEWRKRPSVQNRIAALKELFGGKKIVLGRDKLDYIRGVPHKLLAFERFLREFPEWRDKVVLVQVTSPNGNAFSEDEKSSIVVPRNSYSDRRKLEVHVAELVGRINSQYGSLTSRPVHHIHQTIDEDEYYALLTVADVCLITSIRDGMNLTSHDFVACQQEKMAPIILSEFAGSAGCFSSAIIINPWDYKEVACAINDALLLGPEELASKHRPLINYIRKHTAQYWCTSFLRELHNQAQRERVLVAPLDRTLTVAKMKQCKRRLFMLDYDGTLTPIVQKPEAAVASPALLKALNTLTGDPQNTVFIVSGRDQTFLDHMFASCPAVGLSAEHGTFFKYPKNSCAWEDLSNGIDFSWKDDIIAMLDEYTDKTPGSFVEQKRSSVTWHYRLTDPQFGAYMAQDCYTNLEAFITERLLPVEILVGKKNLEVRPKAISKGQVVQRLLRMFADTEFVFCAGDDRTDEDMFKCLQTVNMDNVVTCLVGPRRKTAATWQLDDPGDVIGLLEIMAAAMDAPASSFLSTSKCGGEIMAAISEQSQFARLAINLVQAVDGFDAVTLKTMVSQAITTLYGLTGAAIQVDILALQPLTRIERKAEAGEMLVFAERHSALIRVQASEWERLWAALTVLSSYSNLTCRIDVLQTSHSLMGLASNSRELL